MSSIGATRLVAGIDCSTQATKVVVCDAETGGIVREGKAPHPDATEVDPAVWFDAFGTAASGLLDGVSALSVAGQQHGMVVVDGYGEVVRPALLWNDTRSAAAAAALTTELGGPRAWATAVGSVPVASLTITKLRWLAETEPGAAGRVEGVMLPHDWLTWRLAGANAHPTTDRGDASGTGYWSPAGERYRLDLLETAFGRRLNVPSVAAPAAIVGYTADGIAIAAGTGDNMAAALGLGIGSGDVVVSVGTSGTAFAVSPTPTFDPSGQVSGFADATGRQLPLVCTLNAARVLTSTAQLIDVDLDGLDLLARDAEPGASGLTMLPYLDGERVPNLPGATGSLHGMTRANLTRANIARAAVEGMLCGLADGVDAIRAQWVPVERILLVGGAARSRSVREVAAGLFGVPVEEPPPAEYVALGAARQAAWALSGETSPPRWAIGSEALTAGDSDYRRVRATYARARDRLMESG